MSTSIQITEYDEFELEIEKPDDDDHSVSDPDFRDDTGDYSVVVKGDFGGGLKASMETISIPAIRQTLTE